MPHFDFLPSLDCLPWLWFLLQFFASFIVFIRKNMVVFSEKTNKMRSWQMGMTEASEQSWAKTPSIKKERIPPTIPGILKLIFLHWELEMSWLNRIALDCHFWFCWNLLFNMSKCAVFYLGHKKDLGVKFRHIFLGNYTWPVSSTLSLGMQCRWRTGLTFFFLHTLKAYRHCLVIVCNWSHLL